MVLRSYLDERPAPVIADTSVVINLNATGYSDAILGALPNQLVERAQLGEVGMSIFSSLVSGSAAETLDDGEAATIACAAERSAIALIDDRKANRIGGERFPNLAFGCTVDVLAQRQVQAVLGSSLPDAVFNALDRGRMRVPDRYGLWVVDLIGRERAAGCRSLPKRFRDGGAAPST